MPRLRRRPPPRERVGWRFRPGRWAGSNRDGYVGRTGLLVLASAKVPQMRIDITPGRGRITVGPPGGPTETIPASVTVTITDTVPYDVEARLEWSPTVGKLAVRKVCCTALPGGDDVSPTGIARIALRDTIQTRTGDRVPRRHRLARTPRQAPRPRPARRRRLDLPARRRLPKPQTHRHRRTRPWPVPRQRTQTSPRRPQSRTPPRHRTRQTRRSMTSASTPDRSRRCLTRRSPSGLRSADTSQMLAGSSTARRGSTPHSVIRRARSTEPPATPMP